MTKKKTPRLRTVEKFPPPFPLNKFPKEFGYRLGREIVYILATKSNPTVEGKEWEQIFSTCIGADWKPSNVGLDDIRMGNCAWGAKTVKSSSKPSKQNLVRLISGRNSPVYSYGDSEVSEVEPNGLGEKVLEIFNERVTSIRQYYKHLRTVVLIKSNDLTEFAVFEFDTIRYDQDLYYWRWNKNRNLEGHEKKSDKHCFTWQPSGSQFTIKEDVPDDCLIIHVKAPELLNKDELLQGLDFDSSWITVSNKNDG